MKLRCPKCERTVEVVKGYEKAFEDLVCYKHKKKKLEIVE